MKRLLKYETPEVKVVNVFIESFICTSGTGSLGDLGDGGDLDEGN